MRRAAVIAIVLALPARAAEPGVEGAPLAGEPAAVDASAAAAASSRPTMLQLPAAAVVEAPPTGRDLAEARAEFEQRYPGLLARGRTTLGAAVLPEVLLEAAAAEEHRDVKWLMLLEARRMAVVAGNAVALDRAILLASATYEFDALAEEVRSLREIPVRLLAADRAATFAEVAERVAGRAESEGRRDVAIMSLNLAVRGWQRAGATESARRAAVRHDELIAAE